MALMQSITLASLLALGGMACAQTGELLGRVVDKTEHAPIRRAFVLIYDEGTLRVQTKKVDEQGRFSVSLPDGDYDVLIGAPGFAPACKRVVVISGKRVRFDAKLDGDLANMEQ
jgi:hypothetical protein